MEDLYYCDICQEGYEDPESLRYCKISDTAWCNDCEGYVEEQADTEYQRQKEEGQ
jgi:hydrogenase maturation factor HypF (carbamoyltransferase family)